MSAALRPAYDDDFYAWTADQAARLRALASERPNQPVDLDLIAEEIEDLGKSERDTVRSIVRTILVHFLKLQFSPSTLPQHGWRGTITDRRAALEDKISRSLLRDTSDHLPRIYAQARERSAIDLEEFGEVAAAHSLPESCPYTLDQILQNGWFPEAPSRQE